MTEPRELAETTVEQLGGVSVGIGNIWDDDYELADGTAAHGPTVRFVLLDGEDETQRIVAGRGSVVRLGSARWEVLEVVEDQHGIDGTVTVRRVD